MRSPSSNSSYHTVQFLHIPDKFPQAVLFFRIGETLLILP